MPEIQANNHRKPPKARRNFAGKLIIRQIKRPLEQGQLTEPTREGPIKEIGGKVQETEAHKGGDLGRNRAGERVVREVKGDERSGIEEARWDSAREVVIRERKTAKSENSAELRREVAG